MKDIKSHLAQRHHSILVILDEDSGDKKYFASFAASDQPHTVTKIENDSISFQLDVSAITVLDSVKMLEELNKQVALTRSYSLQE